MTDIAPIGSSPTQPVHHDAASVQRASDGQAASPSRGSDRAEISQVAQLLSRLDELPDVRQDLIERIRGEIDRGGYDSSDKIDAAIDALADDLK